LTLGPSCARIEAAFQATVLGAPYRLRFAIAYSLPLALRRVGLGVQLCLRFNRRRAM